MRTYFWVTAASLGLLLGCAEDGTKKPNAALPNDSNTTSPDVDGDRRTVSKPALGGGNTPATAVRPGTVNDDADPVRPDNSAVNERDQDEDAIVPTDQGNNERDLEITQEIRQRVVQNKEMSTKGQNVKIITLGGKVTLRGPVASEAEKKIIEEIAFNEAGGKENVTSELEVAPE